MPGGEAAIREPWRMACAWLEEASVEPGDEEPVAWSQVRALARSGVASPTSSSVGRLFDAVSALCGFRTEINYEGQAAIELEAACDPDEDGAYPLPLVQHRRHLLIDARPTVRAVARDLAERVPAGAVAARFHNGLADATARACLVLARRRRTWTVVLGGGSFLNRRLIERTAGALVDGGLRVLTPERLPPGDGGVSYGQAAVAAAQLAARAER